MARLSAAIRATAFALAVAAVLPTGGCGGGDTTVTTTAAEQATTTTTAAGPTARSERSPQQVADVYDAAVEELNATIETTNERFQQDLAAGNLEGLQADASALRDAFFEFDTTLREIPFPASVEDEVNELLDAQRAIIADLDTVGDATTVTEARRAIDRFVEDQASRYAPASSAVPDALLDEIEQHSGRAP